MGLSCPRLAKALQAGIPYPQLAADQAAGLVLDASEALEHSSLDWAFRKERPAAEVLEILKQTYVKSYREEQFPDEWHWLAKTARPMRLQLSPSTVTTCMPSTE